MEQKPQQADVFYRDQKAGVLSKKDPGFEFIYDNAYLENPEAKAISLSLPLRTEKFVSSRLFSFFDGLLPEGWLLATTSAAAHIESHDKFRLLLHSSRF